MSKAVLHGLKPKECKQGSGRVKPPIPYIQEKDELQEAVESTALIKLTLPECLYGLAELRRSSSFTSNKLLQPSRQRAYKRTMRSLFGKKECMEKLEEAVPNRDLAEGEVRDDSPLAKAV